MPTLLGSGSSAYMVRTKNFFRNWSVPAEYRAEYTRIFQGWATFVEKASPQIRDDLKRGQQTNGSYLTHLEPLLDKLGNKFSDNSEQATKAAAARGSPKGGKAASSSSAKAGAGAKPVVCVVAVCALPPGGGKSTFFELLGELGAAIVSSDGLAAKGKKAFDSAMDAAIRNGGKAGGSSGATTQCIGYDKNIPDATGLDKLVRVCSAAGAKHGVEVRVTLVVPGSIDGGVCWERVRSRPQTYVGLCINQGGKGLSESRCKSILMDVFVRPSEQWRSSVAQGATIESNAFWESCTAMQALAAEVFAIAPTGQKVDEVDTFEGSADAPMRAVARTNNWIAVSFDGIAAHVTLVPPAASLPAQEGARKKALKALKAFHGCPVTVRVAGRYRAASRPVSGSVPRGRNGPRRDAPKVTRARVCFWEVEAVVPLGDGAPGTPRGKEFAEGVFEPQAAVYHITDVASKVGGASPKHAGEALAQLRGVEQKASGAVWELETFEHQPFEIVGRIEVK